LEFPDQDEVLARIGPIGAAKQRNDGPMRRGLELRSSEMTTKISPKSL